MARIILYSNDVIGERMAGPGIRYVQMARALGKVHNVLLLAPGNSSFKDDNFQFRSYKKPKDVKIYLWRADVIIAQKLPPVVLRAVRRTSRLRYIVDFYDPVLLENLEANRILPIDQQMAIYNFEYANQTLQLAAADHIFVASERQRDFWLGILMQMGRIIPEVYSDNVSLNRLISIVPFGIASTKPKITDEDALKELIPNLKKNDKVVLWGGGIWNWFDPLSVIEAIEKLAKTHPEIKLLFLGMKHPNPDAPEMAMTSRAVKLATDFGLVGKRIFFNYSWVPYEERQNYVLPCWAAVSAHFDHTETRLSFRTRIVDSYLWGGLPTVATKGDSMADLIEKRQLGAVVDYTDAKGIAEALTKLAEDEKFYEHCQDNILAIQKEFYWEKLVEPISNLIEKNDWLPIVVDNQTFGRLVLNYYKTGVAKVRTVKGFGGIIKKILRK